MVKYYLVSEEKLHELIVAQMKAEIDGIEDWQYCGMTYNEIANEFNPDEIEYEDLDFDDVATAHIETFYGKNKIELEEKEPTKNEIRQIKINALTQAFLDGAVWLEHTGFVLNKDNFFQFVREKGVVPNMRILKNFIKAGYSTSMHYFGWTWQLKGECKFKENVN